MRRQNQHEGSCRTLQNAAKDLLQQGSKIRKVGFAETAEWLKKVYFFQIFILTDKFIIIHTIIQIISSFVCIKFSKKDEKFHDCQKYTFFRQNFPLQGRTGRAERFSEVSQTDTEVGKMVVRHNLSAMNAQRQYNIVGKRKAKHTERLSSGYRINRAADDAAGLSISEKMRRQIRGLNQGIENTQDGVSLCQVADGALNEVHDMIHRLEELSVQAANGTNSKSDREMIQQEIDQLLTEINRISDTTTFNEQNLFGGAAAGKAAGNSAQGGTKAAVPAAVSAQNMTKSAKAAGTLKMMTYSVGAARAAGTACGDFTVSGGTLGTDYDFDTTNGVLIIATGTAITIQNTNPAAATTNRIEVASGVSANITLAGVNIDVSSQYDKAAFKIAHNSSGNVTVTLAGSNTLKSGENRAGLHKSGGISTGTLKIKGNGSLTAMGGFGGAGIGGSYAESGSNITISGGTVTATGGRYGAGIGGGYGGSGNNITISGGTVTATGGRSGAGIGGSLNSDGNNVTISGGTVTATGGQYGAGIGGGEYGSGSSITISGGTVTATGGQYGAGIGGGILGDGNNITISGTSTVVAAKKGNDATDDIGTGSDQSSTSDAVNRNGGLIIEGTSGRVGGSGAAVVTGTNIKLSGNTTVTLQDGQTLTFEKGAVVSGGNITVKDAAGKTLGVVNAGTVADKQILPKPTEYEAAITLPTGVNLQPNTDYTVKVDGKDKTIATDNTGNLVVGGLTSGTSVEIEIEVGGKKYVGKIDVAADGTVTSPALTEKTDSGGGGSGGGGFGGTDTDVPKRWWIQCGSEAGVGMFIEIDAMNTDLLGLSGLNVTTEQGADDAMDRVSGALSYVSALRSKIGAQQNRLEHTIANESNIVENTTAAESHIRDTDMAEEMVAFSLANILEQAGSTMVAQANMSKEGILSLLQ